MREAEVNVRAVRTFGRTGVGDQPSLSRESLQSLANSLRSANHVARRTSMGLAQPGSIYSRKAQHQGPACSRGPGVAEGLRSLTKPANERVSGWTWGGHRGTLRRDERADEAAREERQEVERVQDGSEHCGDGWVAQLRRLWRLDYGALRDLTSPATSKVELSTLETGQMILKLTNPL